MLPPDCPLALWLADRPRTLAAKVCGRQGTPVRHSGKWVLTTPKKLYDTRWQRQPHPAIKRTKAVREAAA